jgi:hypothetical protein
VPLNGVIGILGEHLAQKRLAVSSFFGLKLPHHLFDLRLGGEMIFEVGKRLAACVFLGRRYLGGIVSGQRGDTSHRVARVMLGEVQEAICIPLEVTIRLPSRGGPVATSRTGRQFLRYRSLPGHRNLSTMAFVSMPFVPKIGSWGE